MWAELGLGGFPPCRRADVHPCYACNLIDRDAEKLCFDRLKRRHSHVTTTRKELEITKNPRSTTAPGISAGDPSGIRTPDPLLKRQLLCRLSYRIRVKHLLPINHRPRGRIHGQWQGRLDSNQRMRESKSLALPLGYAPKWKKEGTGDTPAPSCLGWVMGLEPTTPGTTIQCSAN